MQPQEVLKYVSNYLFLSVEVVTAYPSPLQMPKVTQQLWQLKARQYDPDSQQDPLELYQTKAPFMAEFGKIAAIGLAYYNQSEDGKLELRASSHASQHEADILNHFAGTLGKKRFNVKGLQLAGHLIKDFHIPMLGRRYLINQISLPGILHTAYLKPWEVPVQDTMDLWRFTDRKAYISLPSLAYQLGLIQEEGDGPFTSTNLTELLGNSSPELAAQHSTLYHQTPPDLKRISLYAKVKAALAAQSLLMLKGLPPALPANINLV